MQLPPTDELVLVSGVHPIRATKARYYADGRLKERVLATPDLAKAEGTADPGSHCATGRDDWTSLPVPVLATGALGDRQGEAEDPANAGVRREPMLPEHEAVVPEEPTPADEFAALIDEPDDEAVRAKALQDRSFGLARQAALDPDDGVDL
jgi:type IV secretion system protein VirD4